MDSSHEGFIQSVLSCTDKFTASQVRDFIEGGAKSDILSTAFSAFLAGDGALVLKTLNYAEWSKRQPTAQATPA